MADELTEEILEENKGPDTKRMMLIIIIISAVFLVIMGAGFYILWSKVSLSDPQTDQAQVNAEDEKVDEDQIRPVYSLDAFIVNLADRGGTRYLRVTMDLELSSEDTTAEVEKRLPQIRDAILTIVPAKTSKDINTIEGKTTLRDEMIEKLNSFIKNGSVTNIYFTEFVVQ